ncbi:MAG TPA: ParB/RepB/Spo0J family partition protein [Chloroflexota bacterium]|nr:ParB/RepB/Spo0J family partition protein [Chloroflexota bacterium]
MPAPSRRPTLAPVLGPAQGLGVSRPLRLEPVRLPGALEVPIADIAPDPTQPRQNWHHDEGERRLTDLAQSIAEFGILQPLLVRPALVEEEGPPYRLVAGNRRLEAARRAGLVTVPVVVRDTSAVELRILQLTENLLRQDLAPLDEARAYQELIDLEHLSPRRLAARLHISDQQVRLRLRLLSDQVLADAVERRQIAANTARLVQQLPDEEQLPFRERVRLGERLQANDMAAVRARLLAEGAIHPRRTRPPVPRVSETDLVAGESVPPADTPSERASSPGQRSASEAAGPTSEIEGLSVVASGSARTGGNQTQVPLPAGGQILFDPPPSATGEQVPPDIASLLMTASPDTRILLGRVLQGDHDLGIDPHALRDGLLLLADLVRVLARHEPGVAALLVRLGSLDDE